MNPGCFWDGKISGWDRSRYLHANPVSWRTRLAAELLNRLPPQRIADLGCGAGRLLERLEGHQRIGVDFSPKALELAALRCPQARFELLDVTRDALPEADVYVALGLLDWLQPEQIANLLDRFQGKPFLCSFSEWRASPWLVLHWLYIRLTSRPGQPRPAYHRADWLQNQCPQPTRIFRHPKLHFGAFLRHAL